MTKKLPMKKTIIATGIVGIMASLSLMAGNGVADTVNSTTKLNTVTTGTITNGTTTVADNNTNNTTTNSSSIPTSNSTISSTNTTTNTSTSVSSSSANSVGPVAVSRVSVSNLGQPLKAVIYLNKDIAIATFSNGSLVNDGMSLSLEKFNDKQVIILKTTSAFNDAVARISLAITDLDGKAGHINVTLTPAIPASSSSVGVVPLNTNSTSVANNNQNIQHTSTTQAYSDSEDDAPVIHKKKHKIVNVDSASLNSNNTNSGTDSVNNIKNNLSNANTSGLSADAAFVYKKLQAQQEKTVELAKQYQDTLNQQLNLLQKQKKDLSNQEQVVDGKITEVQQKIDEANTNLGHIINNSNSLNNVVNNSTTNSINNTATNVSNVPNVSVPNNTNTVNSTSSTPSVSVPNNVSNSVNSSANLNTNNSIAPTIVAPASSSAVTPTISSVPSVVVPASTPATSLNTAKHDGKVNVDKPKFNVVIPAAPSNSNVSDKALLEGPNASDIKLSEKDKATINQSLNLPNSASSTSMADMVASQVNAASSPIASSDSAASSSSIASAVSPASAASGVLGASGVKAKHPIIKKHHVAQPKPVVEDKSFFDTVIQGIMDNILYVGGGLVVIVLLVLFSFVRKKANKSNIS